MTGPSESLRLCAQIARLARAADADGFTAGLNPAQWEALRFFADANRFSRTASAFARYHGTSRGTASQTVRALVRKGLLDRRRSPSDARRTDLLLSEAGRRALQHDPVRSLCGAIDSLEAGARAQLHRTLAHLAAALAGTLAPVGRCRDCVCLQTRGAPRYFCTAAGEALEIHELDLMCVNHVPRPEGTHGAGAGRSPSECAPS